MHRKKNEVENSTLSPVLTRKTLKRMAGPVYFGRGESYFESRLVKSLVEFDGRITASVTGTEKYDVSLWLEDGELDHSCTCPLGYDGEFCKHCVSVGLEWLEQKKKHGERKEKPCVSFKDLRNYLLAQEKQSLTKIILEQTRKDDRLRQELLAKAARTSSKGLDINALQRAIDNAVEFDKYVDYRSMRYYARIVENAVESIADLLKEGYAIEVIGLTEYALNAVESVMEQVDDSDGYMTDILAYLQEIHLTACKKVKPSPTECENLARRLFHWELNSPWNVFSGTPEIYAKVLGEKGLEVYWELARAELEYLPELKPGDDDSQRWGKGYRITSIMESLARKSGDIDELVKIKSRDLSSPYCFLQIAEIYKKDRKFEKAIEWAERGVKSFPEQADSRLQEFLAEEYHRVGRHGEGMRQAWAVFSSSPGLEKYKLLKTNADNTGEWSTWREKAISLIRKESNKTGKGSGRWISYRHDGSTLVEIFLWEKDVEAAWRVAQKDGCNDQLWIELARKQEKDFPEYAISIYQRRVEPTLAHKKKRAYEQAAGYIKKVSILMKRLGKKEEFLEYIESIRASHKYKRNFINILDRNRLS